MNEVKEEMEGPATAVDAADDDAGPGTTGGGGMRYCSFTTTICISPRMQIVTKKTTRSCIATPVSDLEHHLLPPSPSTATSSNNLLKPTTYGPMVGRNHGLPGSFDPSQHHKQRREPKTHTASSQLPQSITPTTGTPSEGCHDMVPSTQCLPIQRQNTVGHPRYVVLEYVPLTTHSATSSL